MKKILFLFFLISSIFTYSQKLVKGIVFNSRNKPIEGASVYLNNTTIGTITKENGEFELLINEGNYDLVISYMGYKTIEQKFNIENYKTPLQIILIPETNVLNEAVVVKTKYNNEWWNNLYSFKKGFLGQTKLATNCKILNPKALHFDFDPLTGVLTAVAKEPLQIKNNGLGYIIEYDLIDFELSKKTVSYIGRMKFLNLKGGKSKQKRWKKNRLKAFRGSRMHFVRSLRNQNLKEEGFIVNQFQRVKNEDRPSEQEIKEARSIVRSYGNGINFNKDLSNPKTKLDSAMLVLRKVSLPKFRDYLYKRNVPYQDMIAKTNDKIFINFKDYLSIIYTKEPEEDNYLYQNAFKKKKATGMQTSAITLRVEKAILDPTGEIINPLDCFSEGYWGFEGFAETLPLDYQPDN